MCDEPRMYRASITDVFRTYFTVLLLLQNFFFSLKNFTRTWFIEFFLYRTFLTIFFSLHELIYRDTVVLEITEFSYCILALQKQSELPKLCSCFSGTSSNFFTVFLRYQNLSELVCRDLVFLEFTRTFQNLPELV